MKNHSHLVRRKATYYIRVIIPAYLHYLSRKKQYFHSLFTTDFYEALDKLSQARYKIDQRIKLLRAIHMEIQNGKLILNDTDINKMVKQRLEMLDDVLNNCFDDIMDGDFDKETLSIFPKEPFEEKKAQDKSYSEKEYRLDCVEVYIKEYLRGLKTDKKTHHSTFKLLERLDVEDIEIISRTSNPDWQKETVSAMRGLEKYTMDKIDSVAQDIAFTKTIPPRIYSCLQAINAEKSIAMNAAVQSKTKWQKVFKEFSEYKTDAKGTSPNTINDNRLCLETVFEIIGKPYVESITYKDCFLVCNKIGKVPTNRKERFGNTPLSTLIEQEHDKCLSSKSIKKYLGVFKEFMVFCKKRRYIQESFSDDIEIPKKKNGIKRMGFSEVELKKIFNHETYPRRVSRDYAFRYWIPLIALYSGMRSNEICQLYVDDISVQDNIWYFQLSDNHQDQHLKNPHAKRIVPVHPKLIEFGFINFVREVQKSGHQRLFHQLKYSPKNHYTNAIGSWTKRYLKSLGIDSPSKVFHSFRHTAKAHLRDNKVSQEYQNALCGWGSSNIGESVYGGQVPVKILYEELCKLQYPFLDKNLKAIMAHNKTNR